MIFASKYIHALLFLLIFTNLGCLADPAEPLTDSRREGAKKFMLFDSTLYSDKPDLSRYGIQSIKIVYHADLWNEGQDDSKVPAPLRVKDAVRRLPDQHSIAVIDIEHWPVSQANGKLNLENLSKHLEVISLFRKFSPSTKIGFYGIPLPDYWRASNGRGKEEAPLWMAENDRLAPVVDAQDAVFPSLYTFYADRQGWVKYAIAQITEARRLAKGKPVYVFLWPQYHESNPIIGLDYLKSDYWRLELETARQYADGIVLWGGTGEVWKEDAEWWQTTKDFLKSIP